MHVESGECSTADSHLSVVLRWCSLSSNVPSISELRCLCLLFVCITKQRMHTHTHTHLHTQNKISSDWYQKTWGFVRFIVTATIGYFVICQVGRSDRPTRDTNGSSWSNKIGLSVAWTFENSQAVHNKSLEHLQHLPSFAAISAPTHKGK